MEKINLYYRHRPVTFRLCKICEREFGSVRPDARYCSARCRQIISRVQRGIVTLVKPQKKQRKK